MTKGEMAMHVASILEIVVQKNTELARGAWNPNFCAFDATDKTVEFCRKVRSRIDHLEKLARETAGRSSFRTMEPPE